MLVRQLSYLTALARERHFARAAARCNVSQPTLSAGIRSLETQLDVPIVQRGRRFHGLTPEGERVLAWAYRILADYDGLKQDLGVSRGGLTGELRIGIIPAALPALPFWTDPLLQDNPGIRLAVSSLSSSAIETGLARFEIDVGVTYLDNEPLHHVRSTPLYRERYLFATIATPGAEEQRTISWADAALRPLCLLSSAMQNRRIIDAALAVSGARALPRIEADTHLLLASYVRQGRWSTIIPEVHRWLLDGLPGLLLLPLVSPERSQEIGLVTAERDPLPPLAQALLVSVDKLRRSLAHP